MENDEKFTPKKQHDPDAHLREFLRGVEEEGLRQGYSMRARGRFLVLAVRCFEDR